jgi:tetratricopeptide (TPR) repeat protein
VKDRATWWTRNRSGILLLVALSLFAVVDRAQASGASTRDRIDELAKLNASGRYALADSLGTALVVELRRMDPRHPDLPDALDQLGEARVRAGKVTDPETARLAEEALRLTEQRARPDSAALGRRLGGLARALDLAGRKQEAIPQFERSIATLEQSSGPQASITLIAINNYGNCLRDLGRFADAARQFQECLDRMAAMSHPDSAVLGRVYNNYAVVFYYQSEYQRSLRMFRGALAIREAVLPAGHPQIAISRDNVANMEQLLGNYADSRRDYDRALRDQEQAVGLDHINVAESLTNLGSLLEHMGEYGAARDSLLRAVRIYETQKGVDDVDVSIPLITLGLVYQATGDPKEGRQSLERSLAIRIKSLPPNHPDIAQVAHSLGTFLRKEGDLVAARAALERARSILEQQGAEKPPVELAYVLSELGEIHGAAGELAAAESSYARALVIRRANLPADHPEIASSMIEAAWARHEAGHGETARDSIEAAIAIEERVLGPDHGDVAAALCKDAMIRVESGDSTGAFVGFHRAETIRQQRLILTTSVLPERLALRCAAANHQSLDALVAMAAASRSDPEVAEAWDAVLTSRGLVLEEMAARHRIALTAGDAKIRVIQDSLVAARARLAHLALISGGESPSVYRGLVADAASEKDRLERALASGSREARSSLAQRPVHYDDVVRALDHGSALVAFVRYAPPRDHEAHRAQMAAFVLANGKRRIVPLGDAERIDGLVERWRARVSRPPRNAASEKSETLACRRAGAELRARIWDLVATRVNGAKRVYVVPEGSLNLVSWGALPSMGGRYLVETGPLVQVLGTERDLIPPSTESVGSGLLAMGGPDYGGDNSSVAATTRSGSDEEGESGDVYRGPTSGCNDFTSVRFAPLDASRSEVEAITETWRSSKRGREPVLTLTGTEATEAAFKERAKGRRVIHLATHGFFLGGRCASTHASDVGLDETLPVVTGENPLLLSGLAMAGANRRQSVRRGEDGVLTAEEIAALDLSGVQWVALSACESGLGVVEAGEGVFGLRRAFTLAGARSVISSLWRVDDEAARYWATSLYKNAPSHDWDAAASTRAATLEFLAARRGLHQSVHPFYWGAFVAAGR